MEEWIVSTVAKIIRDEILYDTHPMKILHLIVKTVSGFFNTCKLS